MSAAGLSPPSVCLRLLLLLILVYRSYILPFSTLAYAAQRAGLHRLAFGLFTCITTFTLNLSGRTPGRNVVTCYKPYDQSPFHISATM